MKPGLLFLAHRIPYPPNKGDKVRSFHLLAHLAASYRVFLGSFVDDPADWVHSGTVAGYCADLCLRPLAPRLARLRALPALLGATPLTVPYYRDRALAQWASAVVLEHGVRRVLVFSSAMAQFVPRVAVGIRTIVDFVDVDSDKWRQYAARARGPMRWVYRREADTLLEHERRTALGAQASVFVSEHEAELFRRLAPQAAERVVCVDNGVDLDYFSPARDYPDPYRAGEVVITFTGAMDYWANVEAVAWFAREVLPSIRTRLPEARFYVVGARPTPAVLALAAQPGVVVTGTVADVRPYLAHADLSVAPLRIARGVQNKVLEALAMARPVVATGLALQGVTAREELPVLVADDAAGMARACLGVLGGGDTSLLGARGRRFVERHYDWQANLARFDALLEGAAEDHARRGGPGDGGSGKSDRRVAGGEHVRA